MFDFGIWQVSKRRRTYLVKFGGGWSCEIRYRGKPRVKKTARVRDDGK